MNCRGLAGLIAHSHRSIEGQEHVQRIDKIMVNHPEYPHGYTQYKTSELSLHNRLYNEVGIRPKRLKTVTMRDYLFYFLASAGRLPATGPRYVAYAQSRLDCSKTNWVDTLGPDITLKGVRLPAAEQSDLRIRVP